MPSDHENLRIPGPTPLPPEVLAALSHPMVNHRGPEFKALHEEVVGGLKRVFGVRGDVLIFPAASTGGMESAVVNTLSPGDHVLAVSIGYFGDRFARIAADFGAVVTKLDYRWGRAANPADIAEALRKDPNIKAVLVTHNETSTGVTNDVESISRLMHGRPQLLIVDAVSSLAAIPLPVDEWGLDVVVTGSQKALMTPPGLAVVSVNERAWQANKAAKMPRHYWDWAAAKKYQERWMTPYTPALSLLFALRAALGLIQAEGLEAVYSRHRSVAAAARRGVQELGLSLFADPAHASDTVTSVSVPEGVDGKELVSRIRTEHRVILGGGQGPLEGSIFRIGHLGWVSGSNIDGVMQALRAVLGR